MVGDCEGEVTHACGLSQVDVVEGIQSSGGRMKGLQQTQVLEGGTEERGGRERLTALLYQTVTMGSKGWLGWSVDTCRSEELLTSLPQTPSTQDRCCYRQQDKTKNS